MNFEFLFILVGILNPIKLSDPTKATPPPKLIILDKYLHGEINRCSASDMGSNLRLKSLQCRFEVLQYIQIIKCRIAYCNESVGSEYVYTIIICLSTLFTLTEAASNDVLTFKNLQALESKEEVPVVIDEESKAEKPDEITTL